MSASISALADAIRPLDSVYIAGSTGEPSALIDAWTSDPPRSRDLRILTSAVPGINNLGLDQLDPSAHVTGLFMQPSFREAQRAGRYHWLPLSYGGFEKFVRERSDPTDICIVQVSPAGPDGRHSLGLSVEFLPAIMSRARRFLCIVNHAMPYIRSSPSVPADMFEVVCHVETELPTYETGPVDPASMRIATIIAEYVRDGAALQVGVGKAPAALMAMLGSHKNLRIQSGMLGDGFRTLAERGALDPDWVHQGCVMVGSGALYRWAASQDIFEIAGCDVTHNAARLAGIERFTAVNSAIEIDLYGQCNLEFAGGRAVSGAGGAPDFARAAKLAPGGTSIIAMQATAREGQVSRIVPRLSEGAVTSLSRVDIDLVVTEFGCADLRDADVRTRGERLIDIADPKFQNQLSADWHAIMGRI